jgi:hypothetical protein
LLLPDIRLLSAGAAVSPGACTQHMETAHRVIGHTGSMMHMGMSHKIETAGNKIPIHRNPLHPYTPSVALGQAELGGAPVVAISPPSRLQMSVGTAQPAQPVRK